MSKKKIIISNLVSVWLLATTTCIAQATVETKPQTGSIFMSTEFYLLALVLLILLIVILGLAKTTVGLSKAFSQLKKKSSASIILFLFATTSAFAQTQNATEPEGATPAWLFNPNFYIGAFLLFILLLTIYVLYMVNMRIIKAMTPQTVKAVDELSLVIAKKPNLFRRIYLCMVDSVPVAQEKDILLDHEYDGIKELDNNLPPWWKYGFYFTIVFGIIYLLYYHVGGTGKLQAQEYQDEILLAEKQKEERLKASADNVNEENVVALADASLIINGKETFQKLCAACHLANGGGQVGPNLTDEYWLHGGGIKNIFKTITYGVPAKGMISWQAQLSPKQIQQVASYILTLHGTKPEGAKEPQGEIWVEEKIAADTAGVGLNDSIK